MSRFHMHVGVADLDKSIAFYSGLFGTAPSVTKPDYANWMLDDPRINFAISVREDAHRGIEHVGLQVEDAAELAAVYGRLKDAGAPVLEGARRPVATRSPKKVGSPTPTGWCGKRF